MSDVQRAIEIVEVRYGLHYYDGRRYLCKADADVILDSLRELRAIRVVCLSCGKPLERIQGVDVCTDWDCAGKALPMAKA